MKRNKRNYMLAGAVLAAACISSAESASAQSIVYQLGRSDTTANLGGISSLNVVSSGSQSGTVLSFDILGLVSGGTNVANNVFQWGEFKVASSASGAAAVLPGNMTFTPAAQYQNSSDGANFYNIPTTNTTSAVGTQVGDPTQATLQAGSTDIDASTVFVNLGTGTAATAMGIETISGTQYNVFKLGTVTFTTTAVAGDGQADTISIVPVSSAAGSVYSPQKAVINGVLTDFNSASALNLNIVTSLVGDTNGDGAVDFSDFGTLVNAYGNPVTNAASQGDFNGDGVVDFTDFGALVNNYGAGTTPSVLGAHLSSAVPEPTSLALLAAAPLFAMRRRRAK